MAATDAQFKYPSVCKSKLGQRLLFQVTGEERYRRDHAAGDWYVATQEEEGFWHAWLERTEADPIWITLEYVMHLDTALVLQSRVMSSP